MESTTTFPAFVKERIGARFVLVVKATIDFCNATETGPDWFDNFWWVSNEQTSPKRIAFYDTEEEALDAGEEFAKTGDGVYNWAVYDSYGALVDGAF